MNYIIFDLEFNQSCNFIKGNKNIVNPICPFEIIQIGAVKLDKNFTTISTLDKLVKPELYTDIHPFVKKLTGITTEELTASKPFKEIYKEFIEFIEKDPSIFCVWGMSDMKELFRNIKYHKLSTFSLPREYINLQLYASKYFNCPKGTNIGLQNTVELLNITFENQFHNAFNDAYYTTEILKKIFNEEITPKIYNPDKQTSLNRYNHRKQKLNTYKLIKQFEKMFNREMTTEEKSIIKLAYIMGKTNQFQVEIPNN